MVLMRRKSFADPASLPPSASAPSLPRIGAMPPEHTLRGSTKGAGKAEAPPPNLNLARRGASSGAVRVPSWDTR